MDDVAIGGYVGGSNFSDEDIAEVIIYSDELTTAEWTDVEAYITDKYAL
jgi:hypothetical protein